MLRLIVGGIVALLALIGYCGSQETNPVTGEDQRVALTAEQETALGLQAASQLSGRYGGLDPDGGLQARVDRIGERIIRGSAAAESPYAFEFHVLDDGETLNAFALPGGQVFITEGLLARLGTEARVAGVLAHEVGHVAARHAARRATVAAPFALVFGLPAAIGQLATMKFSRDDELESDELAVRFLDEAGYDPGAMVEVLRILSEQGGAVPEFFSTHPSPENRLERIRELVESRR
jgi:predicted Zn-dependent protease